MNRVKKSCNKHWTEQWKAEHLLLLLTDSALSETVNGSLLFTKVELLSKELMNNSLKMSTHISTNLNPEWKCDQHL